MKRWWWKKCISMETASRLQDSHRRHFLHEEISRWNGIAPHYGGSERAFASAAIASNLHLKERKDMHAMQAHLVLAKSISSWLVPLPFWLCNCFSVPHLQSNIIHILSVFPSPLCFVFLSFQLTPCFPLGPLTLPNKGKWRWLCLWQNNLSSPSM